MPVPRFHLGETKLFRKFTIDCSLFNLFQAQNVRKYKKANTYENDWVRSES